MNMDPGLDRRGQYAGDDPEEPVFKIDGRAILGTIYRNRLVLLACVLACLFASIVYLILATPMFDAEASVQIEEQSTKVFKDNDDSGSSQAFDSARFLNTQVDIIKSRSVALETARALNLLGNVDFLRRMHLRPTLATSSIMPTRQAQEQQVAAVIDSHMTVDLPLESRIATITFRSPDPVLSAQVANGIAESFIRTDLSRRYGASAYARQFIAQQLQDAKQQLERSERAALDYSSRERLIDTSNGSDASQNATTSGPKSLTVARLVSLNSAYADAVARRTQAEQKWGQAQGAAIMSLPEVLANGSVQALLQRRAQAVAEYQDQRQIRKEDFPSVRQAKAQIDELTRQIDRLSGNIRDSLRSQYEAALRQENSLKGQIGGLEQATLAEQQREVQLSILRRATDTSRSLYDTLLQRFRELNAQAGVQPNNIQLIDRADIPGGPVSPRPIIAVLLGLVAGLVTGVAAIFILENLNETVRTGEDVARKLNVPLLGSVPKVQSADVGADLLDLKSTVSEAYSSIRAALLLSTREGLPARIAFTSTQPSEGKTTSCFALAISLARIGKRVVVVDCDLRRPALHKMFGVPNTIGASNFLSGQAGVGDVMQPSQFENVSVITAGPIPPNPTELLSGSLFSAMIEELQKRTDVVIIDSPPILGLADAVVIGAKVDATVLVLQAGRNYHGSLKSAVARLNAGGTRLIGAIITKQNVREIGYAYSSSYYYTYKEKD